MLPPTEVHNEAEFTAPRPDCPNPDRWTAPDIQGTEFEVIDMVAGLVRGLQPTFCVETGTHRGFMAKAIGKALVKNGQGMLTTLEVDPDLHAEATKRVQGLPVDARLQSSMEYRPSTWIDFCWFDSLIHLRVPEFLRYAPWMTRNTIVGFHDTAVHHGPWSDAVRSHPRLQVLDLPTPRGVLLCRYRP